MELNKKREQEKQVVALMIHLYCRHHDDIDEKELTEYALQRIDRCPMMATKTFCSRCKIHCYHPKKQEEIKKVMRYSGPRMIFYHPLLAIKHLLSSQGEAK